MDCLIVLVTVPNEKVAKDIASGVIEARLAACVNILPKITSIYHWEGKTEESSELLLIIKTNSTRLPELESKVLSLHPYDTPEFVAIEAEQVSQKYLHWLNSSLT